MLYYMNVDTGKVIAREVGDEPYGDLWLEIEESEYQDRLHPLSPANTGLQADGANVPEHTGTPYTCEHPDCKKWWGDRPAAKA